MKRFVLLFVVVLYALNTEAQDPAFYNSNQSLIYLNPSFAGSNGGVRNQTSYRNQWYQTNYRFVTSLNTFDIYLKAIKGGLALSFMNDDLFNGLLKTNSISLSYAQYLSLMGGNLKVIPSLQMTYGRRSLDVSNLSYGEISDPRYGYVWGNTSIPSTNKSYVDLSSGLLITYKNKLYVGGSFFHMNQPDIGLSGARRLPFSFNFYSSYNFTLSEKSKLQAFYLFNTQDLSSTNRVGLNLISFNHLISGIGLVNWDSPVISAGYRNNYFNLLFSYDFTLDKLAGDTYDSWELHASFNHRNKEQRKALTSFESW